VTFELVDLTIRAPISSFTSTGIPITQTAATPGHSKITSSISVGEIYKNIFDLY